MSTASFSGMRAYVLCSGLLAHIAGSEFSIVIWLSPFLKLFVIKSKMYMKKIRAAEKVPP